METMNEMKSNCFGIYSVQALSSVSSGSTYRILFHAEQSYLKR